MNYLKTSDLWSKDIYEQPNFNKNLNELRNINAKMSQIIPLYEALGKDIKDSDYDIVRKQIEIETELEKEPSVHDREDPGDDSDSEFAKKSDDDSDRD